MKKSIEKFGISIAESIDDEIYYTVKGRFSGSGESLSDLNDPDYTDLFQTIYKTLKKLMEERIK